MNVSGTNIIDTIKRWASETPDEIAVISGGGEISYGDLADRFERLSELLHQYGVGPETPVAVSADRSLEWIVALLAIWHRGGMYVPINPATALHRKLDIIQDSGTCLLLTEPDIPPVVLNGLRTELIPQELLPQGVADRSRPSTVPGQAAYQMYTSGSTGKPKGVTVSHSSLLHYAGALRAELEITPIDRYLHTASMDFSASMRQLLASLSSGATVVVASRDQTRDPAALIACMLRHGVTILDTVPSYLARWADAACALAPSTLQQLGSSLRLVSTTGEPLRADTVISLRTVLPQIKIFNLYGQTETTGTVSFYLVPPIVSGPIPIGPPSEDNQFFVLDKQGNPAPEGELYVAGPCLAKGYNNRPELNNSRFLSNTLDPAFGDRLYRTGDRVRTLPNGLLQYLGRTDNQVKLNGIRLDLGEVEATLLKHAGVVEAAAVLRVTGPENEGLVVFIVKGPNAQSVTAEQIRSFAVTELGDAITLSVVQFLEALPRTASGKVDRPALQEFDISIARHREMQNEELDGTKAVVAKCWEEVLDITGVGSDDDFFALGGDSIQAMRMINRLQKRLGVRMPLGALFFEDPSLNGFATAIDERMTTAAV